MQTSVNLNRCQAWPRHHQNSESRTLTVTRVSGRWSVSGVSALSLSLCGFIMAWLVSLTWNLNKVELEVPSFLPVNLTRPAETINADHNPSGSDPSRPTAVFKLGASLPVPGEVSVGPPGHPGRSSSSTVTVVLTAGPSLGTGKLLVAGPAPPAGTPLSHGHCRGTVGAADGPCRTITGTRQAEATGSDSGCTDSLRLAVWH